jgi:hypothetical protein
VQRLQRIIAFVLFALWLSATLHSDLEAAGINYVFGGHDHASLARQHSGCAHDRVDDEVQHSTDGVSYRHDSLDLKVPLPAFAFLYPVGTIPLFAPIDLPAKFVAETGAAPPEVARTWHFLRRAAPPPRAPSLVV